MLHFKCVDDNEDSESTMFDKMDTTPMRSLKSSQVLFQIAGATPPHSPWIEYSKFIVERRYAEDAPAMIQNLRSSHVLLNPEDVFPLPQYEGMKKWFADNVSNFYRQKDNWSGHIPPERLLYIYGLQGMGRALNITNLCREAKVNILFVRSCINDHNIISSTIERAKSMSPCVILFDDADYIVTSPTNMTALYANMNGRLNPRSDNVWIILTSNMNPGLAHCDKLAKEDPSLYNTMRMLYDCIKRYGSITFVPVIKDHEVAKSLCIQLLRNAARNSDYPQSPDEQPWQRTITHMALYSELCTVREVDTFIVDVFRNYFKKLHKVVGAPSHFEFEDSFKDLPFVDSFSDNRVMTTRTVKRDHDHMSGNIADINQLPSCVFKVVAPCMQGATGATYATYAPPMPSVAPVLAPAPVLTQTQRDQLRVQERNRHHQISQQAQENENPFSFLPSLTSPSSPSPSSIFNNNSPKQIDVVQTSPSTPSPPRQIPVSPTKQKKRLAPSSSTSSSPSSSMMMVTTSTTTTRSACDAFFSRMKQQRTN